MSVLSKSERVVPREMNDMPICAPLNDGDTAVQVEDQVQEAQGAAAPFSFPAALLRTDLSLHRLPETGHARR